jgi:hypothetical protein
MPARTSSTREFMGGSGPGVNKSDTDKRLAKLRDMLTGQVLVGTPQGAKTVFNTPREPGDYLVTITSFFPLISS